MIVGKRMTSSSADLAGLFDQPAASSLLPSPLIMSPPYQTQFSGMQQNMAGQNGMQTNVGTQPNSMGMQQMMGMQNSMQQNTGGMQNTMQLNMGMQNSSMQQKMQNLGGGFQQNMGMQPSGNMQPSMQYALGKSVIQTVTKFSIKK